jgi:uncharacterized protein (TIGR02145 family)
MMNYKLILIALLFFPITYYNSCSDPLSKDDYPGNIEESDPISDIDGNSYNTVMIGKDIWMAANLNVSHFRNGDPIPEARTKEQWLQAAAQKSPAWCYYNNDPQNGLLYGKLYNWYALSDLRGLEPEGWRVPGNRKWQNFYGNLGGDDIAARKMKSTSGWNPPDQGDNTAKFQALPGGGRTFEGDFADLGNAAIWWSYSELSAVSASAYNILQNSDKIYRGIFDKASGLSVRAVYCPTCVDDTTKVLTLTDKLQKVLDDAVSAGTGVGLSAAVILTDGTTWQGTSGLSHGTTAITPDMRFAAGSIGKMFTAVTILQLAEKGYLNLDDAISQWLPVYPNVDSSITIRQLLNHTSGVSDFVDHPDYWDSIFANPEKVWTLPEIVTTFSAEALFPKGTGWNYSTTGYNLLRMIIMHIQQTDLATVYNERFLAPLGLNDTFILLNAQLPGDVAHGWYDLNSSIYEDFYSWPRTAFVTGIAGEIWTTPRDLVGWLKALFVDKAVLGPDMLEQMLTFHAPCTGEEFVCDGYGLGVVRFNSLLVDGLLAYGHGGNAPGYAASCMFLPEYKVVLAVMDNTEYGEAIGSSSTGLVRVLKAYLDE